MKVNRAATGITSVASVNMSVFLKNATLSIEGMSKTKNALRHDLVAFEPHRSSLKTVPSLVLGLANAKKKNNIKNM